MHEAERVPTPPYPASGLLMVGDEIVGVRVVEGRFSPPRSFRWRPRAKLKGSGPPLKRADVYSLVPAHQSRRRPRAALFAGRACASSNSTRKSGMTAQVCLALLWRRLGDSPHCVAAPSAPALDNRAANDADAVICRQRHARWRGSATAPLTAISSCSGNSCSRGVRSC